MISRVISALNGVTLIITLLIINVLGPLPLQVGASRVGIGGPSESSGLGRMCEVLERLARCWGLAWVEGFRVLGV